MQSSVPKRFISSKGLCFTILKKLLTQLNSLFYCTIYSHSALTVNHGASSKPAWYQSPISCVKPNNNLSAPFPISRGVKQGSVLSPSLFLVIMNSFLQRMRNLNSGGSLHDTFTGSAFHADDVRSIAPSIQSIITQSSEINSFTNNVGLKLNTSKLEVIQLSQKPTEPQDITLADVTITTKKSARCLGVEWQSNLSGNKSISTNIAKARNAFFGLGSTKAFHGDLNPLSSSNIFETCVLPVLLYGCETWLLVSKPLKNFNVK